MNYIEHILQFLKTPQGTQRTLPKKIRKITVLRSPHIDKKSREQFQIKRQKSILSLWIPDFQRACLFLDILKHAYFPGIELAITIKFTEPFEKERISLF